jgi:RNA polymerase sigma factor (sigma-70 family)
LQPNTIGEVEFAHDTASHRLVEALHGLDPIDRAIVVLRHLLEYRSPEIGKVLELPASTVRTRLRRAMAELRETLDLENDPDLERMR